MLHRLPLHLTCTIIIIIDIEAKLSTVRVTQGNDKTGCIGPSSSSADHDSGCLFATKYGSCPIFLMNAVTNNSLHIWNQSANTSMGREGKGREGKEREHNMSMGRGVGWGGGKNSTLYKIH